MGPGESRAARRVWGGLYQQVDKGCGLGGSYVQGPATGETGMQGPATGQAEYPWTVRLSMQHQMLSSGRVVSAHTGGGWAGRGLQSFSPCDPAAGQCLPALLPMRLQDKTCRKAA